MDKESNLFMNLTFYVSCLNVVVALLLCNLQEAKGTMIGELYRDDSPNAVEMMFSVQTSDQLEKTFQSSVAVPPSVVSLLRKNTLRTHTLNLELSTSSLYSSIWRPGSSKMRFVGL